MTSASEFKSEEEKAAYERVNALMREVFNVVMSRSDDMPPVEAVGALAGCLGLIVGNTQDSVEDADKALDRALNIVAKHQAKLVIEARTKH